MGRQTKFELMLDFMEKHGDLSKCRNGDEGKVENIKKWHELTKILNNKLTDEAKPMGKWRKVWSDFKNNTKKKLARYNKSGGPVLTDPEKKVLLLMKKWRHEQKQLTKDSDEDIPMFKEEYHETNSSPAQIFCDVNESSSLNRASVSPHRVSIESCSSVGSCSLDGKRKRRRSDDETRDFAYTYIKLERKRDKRAHERELARIEQNGRLIDLFGRIVTAFEDLAPSIKKFLDSNTKENS